MTRRRTRGRWTTLAAAALVPGLATCSLRSSAYLTRNGAADASQDITPSLDAPPQDDAGDAGPWCLRHQPDASGCIDFDEQSLSLGFERGKLVTIPSPRVDPGAAAGLDADGASGAFVATTGAIPDGGHLGARFDSPFVLSMGDSVTLRFELRLLAFTGATEIDIAVLYLSNEDGGSVVRGYFELVGSMAAIAIDNGGPSTTTTFNLLADGNWHTYFMTLKLADPASPGTSTLALYEDVADTGGTPAYVVHQPATLSGAAFATFLVGTDVYGPSPPAEIALDNVVFASP